MNFYGLLAIIFLQGVAISFLIAFSKEISKQIYLKNMILLSVIVIYLVIDLYFLVTRIILLRRLLEKKPVKCQLVDVFLVSPKDDKRTKYQPFPIVRSLEDQQLYFSYGKYSLMPFTMIQNNSGGDDFCCTIYKSDHTPVKLGETVDMYILKTIDLSVSVDRRRSIVQLNRRRAYFRHVNQQLDINVFKEMTFFKGVIDVG